jgi:hypothetical protein
MLDMVSAVRALISPVAGAAFVITEIVPEALESLMPERTFTLPPKFVADIPPIISIGAPRTFSEDPDEREIEPPWRASPMLKTIEPLLPSPLLGPPRT